MTHITLPRAVVEQALDALEFSNAGDIMRGEQAITALRAAIAEMEKCEPVAWIHRHKAYPTKVDDMAPGYYGSAWSHEPLYTHPAPAVPEMVLVPKEPTEDMLDAVRSVEYTGAYEAYANMIAAAPKD